MKEYYFVNNGKKIGPFSVEVLKDKYLSKETLIWTSGMDDWRKLKDIPELIVEFDLQNQPPPIPISRKVKLLRLLIFWFAFHLFALVTSYSKINIFNSKYSEQDLIWPFSSYFHYDPYWSVINKWHCFNGIFSSYDFSEFILYISMGVVIYYLLSLLIKEIETKMKPYFSLANWINKKPLISQEDNSQTKVNKNEALENPNSRFRNQSLSTTPDQLQLKLDSNKKIAYGIVMDWNNGKTVITVVTFATGEASFCISTRQNHIGSYAQENIKSAALVFIKEGQQFLAKAKLTTETPMPERGCIIFYFLTNKGKCFLQGTMENIINEKSDLKSLFILGNRLLTEYMSIKDKWIIG